MPFLEGPLGFTTPGGRAQKTQKKRKCLLALTDSGFFQESFYKTFSIKLLTFTRMFKRLRPVFVPIITAETEINLDKE